MRYVIQEPLGQGGSGAVFRALDQQLSREVAIKRIREDADIESSIRKEAGIMAALHHPNIVTIYDFAADEQGPFVVMELVEGRTLDDIVSEHPMKLRTFYELVDQVCKGLGSAHERGLVHCDIKPKNIMLQYHGDKTFTVKILDFGLARMEMELEEANADGTVAGTPHTISPEQLLRQPTDARSDIYSLGCVFYFALSGLFPHDAEDIQQIVQNHLNGTIKPLHRINPEIPEPISRAISKMVSLDPNLRQQSAQEVRNSLWAAARAPSSKGVVGGSTTRSIRPGSTRIPSPHQKSTTINPAPIHHAMEAEAIFDRVEAAPPPPPPPKPPKNMTWLYILMTCVSLGLIAGGAWFIKNRQLSNNLPTVNPLNAEMVEKHSGEMVNVEGTVLSVTESVLFHAYYLKFSDKEDDLMISVSFDAASGAQLKALIGKRVRAVGRIEEAANVPRLVVQSLGDIKEL